MKANEFVKKFGLGEAKVLLAKHEKSFMPRVFDMWSDELQDFVLAEKHASFDMDDLKRLVESHQIVNTTFKGLEDAKWWHECCWDCDSVAYIPTDRLKQAIADVESCQ